MNVWLFLSSHSIILVLFNKPDEFIIPIISLLVVAGSRFIPSFNIINKSFSEIKLFKESFDSVIETITKDNKENFVYATSWGVTTRLIGALIMVHGDDKGLRLPPNIAPIQIAVIPIFKSEEELNIINSTLKNLMNDLDKNHII